MTATPHAVFALPRIALLDENANQEQRLAWYREYCRRTDEVTLALARTVAMALSGLVAEEDGCTTCEWGTQSFEALRLVFASLEPAIQRKVAELVADADTMRLIQP